MTAHLLKWWTILRISLEERFVYRGDFALGTLMRFLPIITQIFLWTAVFAAVEQVGSQAGSQVEQASGAAVEQAQTGTATTVAGYSLSAMIAYYLLTMISRAFSSMPGLASGIALQVRNGEIKKFLIQPVDMVGFLLLTRTAHKLAYYTIAILPFALVFYLCRGYFELGWPDLERMVVYVSSLLLAFMLGFFLEASIGLISFWFLEVSSLLFVYNLLTFFLSGHMFPLDLLPELAQQIITFLPLHYLAYFPAAVFLEKIPQSEMWIGLGIQAAWVLAFIGISRLMLNRGLHRYSGFGG